MADTTYSISDLKILDASYIKECSKVIAEAFSDDPTYRYVFRGTKAYRRNSLEWLFERNLKLTMGKSPSVLRGILNNETGQVLCCFLWTPLEHSDLSMWEMLTAGLWEVPFRFGFPTLQRLLNLIDSMKADGSNIGTHDGTTPLDSRNQEESEKVYMIKLERMAVLPSFQGRGLGSKALRSVLEEEQQKVNKMPGENPQIHIEFTTQLERNVQFYLRLGYKVTFDKDYYEEVSEYTFHSWHMMQVLTKQ
ncbi:Acetyltransferase (GNAT) family [Seminavis robusta]|uniref:Acetyltransferase (GNAT) family n=1 Tax=Seminavis robusta TaxID=568900 RepID=A0A9N8EP14_9STRA|nr:Acetyltransferase (GNAT) family [Seminavis robusta]|eukprot:Sro1665_g289620.1 Acetyltransferase (GNAT) family (249) ;mRNA; r:20319-21065